MPNQDKQISHDVLFSEIEKLLNTTPVESRDNKWVNEYKSLVAFETALREKTDISTNNVNAFVDLFQNVRK
jgi:hypothetical protein